MSQSRSITESTNALSADIDLASPDAIVRILRQTDAQIFSGYLGYVGLYDPEHIDGLIKLARRAAEVLGDRNGRIILSGAGTSGRLAMFEARLLNEGYTSQDRQPFRYLIAGGDAALIEAQEGAEDDSKLAQSDLAFASKGASQVFYIGITCGLSAPYIASQLEVMLTRENDFAVLMGFNPVQLARDTPIENWPYTFLDTAKRVASAPNAKVLNPIVGPEPITGSTRMKSGSATKFLLEVLFYVAMEMEKGNVRTDEEARELILQKLLMFENAYRHAYLQVNDLAKLVSLGGSALRNGRHIYYVGTSGIDEAGNFVGGPNAGILALVDASECPPTYGADFEDVRGFILGGWKALFPTEDKDLSEAGKNFRISLEDFEKEKLPSLRDNDLVVCLGNFTRRSELLQKARVARAHTAVLDWNETPAEADVSITLMSPQICGNAPLELQIKLILNALTTGAHVLAGKVFGNRMIDLRISNNKLYHRTIGIICDLMQVSSEEAREALLRSIYQTDRLTDSQREATIRDYIEQAKTVDKVVPKALLIATGKFSYGDATQALRKNPVVRSVLEQYVK